MLLKLRFDAAKQPCSINDSVVDACRNQYDCLHAEQKRQVLELQVNFALMSVSGLVIAIWLRTNVAEFMFAKARHVVAACIFLHHHSAVRAAPESVLLVQFFSSHAITFLLTLQPQTF